MNDRKATAITAALTALFIVYNTLVWFFHDAAIIASFMCAAALTAWAVYNLLRDRK